MVGTIAACRMAQHCIWGQGEPSAVFTASPWRDAVRWWGFPAWHSWHDMAYHSPWLHNTVAHRMAWHGPVDGTRAHGNTKTQGNTTHGDVCPAG